MHIASAWCLVSCVFPLDAVASACTPSSVSLQTLPGHSLPYALHTLQGTVSPCFPQQQ